MFDMKILVDAFSHESKHQYFHYKKLYETKDVTST